MLNAYPDSLGGTLGDIVNLLEKEEMKDVFSSFYILPSLYHSDLDRGFSVIDYGLNEELASRDDLERLKELGIDLKLDFILNHASAQSPQFKDLVAKGEQSEYRNFFINWNRFWDGYGKMTEEGYIQPDEESVKATREAYEEYNKVLLGQVEKFDFEFANLFKMSTIIKGAVGFVIGLFIIFVIAICDRRVRTREELERFFDGDGVFLGEFKKNDRLSEEVTAASISAMCEKAGVSGVLLTTVGKQKNAEALCRLAETATTDKVRFSSVDGIEVCPETSRAVAAAEGTIIMVNGGFDEIHTIKTALARVNTVNGNLLGYILCK